jgi:hypothetical protein
MCYYISYEWCVTIKVHLRVLAVNPFLTASRFYCLKRPAQYNSFVKALSNVSQIYIIDACTETLICDVLQCFEVAAVEQRKNAVDFSSYYMHLNMTALFPVKFRPVRHHI